MLKLCDHDNLLMLCCNIGFYAVDEVIALVSY